MKTSNFFNQPLAGFSALLCLSSVVGAAPFFNPQDTQCHCSPDATPSPASFIVADPPSEAANFCSQLAREVEQWQASSNIPVAYRPGVQRVSEDGDKLAITLGRRSVMLEYPKQSDEDSLIEGPDDERPPIPQRQMTCRPMLPSEQLRTNLEAYNSGTLYVMKISIAILLSLCFLDGLWMGWT